MQNHYPPGWIARLFGILSIPNTAENRKLFDAWGRAEGGTAIWNPLNTTFDLVGFVINDYNSVGVKNYSSPVGGIAATALTLTFAPYRGLLGSLQAGKLSAVGIVQANVPAFAAWGTGASNVLRILESE